MNSPARPSHATALTRRRVRGITLIEVAIALALSMVVLSAVGYAYVQSRLTIRAHEELALVQGAARLAIDQIGRDVRQAGYVGCNSSLRRSAQLRGTDIEVLPPFDPAAPLPGPENFTIDARNALRVFRSSEDAAVWAGSVPANAVTDGHVIEVRYGIADGATRLRGPIARPDRLATFGTLAPTHDDNDTGAGNRLALLSDCASAMAVVVSATGPDWVATPRQYPVDPTRCAHASRVGSSCFYWPSTVVMPLRVVQYYVADFGTTQRPERRLMQRKRVMDPFSIRWNEPEVVLSGVRSLRATGAGLDTPFPAPLNWQSTRTVDESLSPDVVADLSADDARRLVRLDVRLSMQANRPHGGTDAPVIRNFEASFTVRARVTPDPT